MFMGTCREKTIFDSSISDNTQRVMMLKMEEEGEVNGEGEEREERRCQNEVAEREATIRVNLALQSYIRRRY